MTRIRFALRCLTVAAGAAALMLPQTSAGAAGATDTAAHAPSTCSVAALQAVHRQGLSVTGANLVIDGRFTPPGSSPITGLPAFCAVSAVQRDAANNAMRIALWLPTTRWNHSFEGVGGGGYSCGISWPALADALRSGYATASTDCGDPNPADALTGAFALHPSGSLNRPLIEDFAQVGIHDMSVDGQALAASFYRRRASDSYFNGCSGGGREALMEAQRFPRDYHGILAASPAINWTRFIPAEFWPQLVMAQHRDVLSACKETAFTEAVIRACDADDGVTDGVIGDPGRCHWNPQRLVGTVTPCGTITATDAAVIRAIWDGPRAAEGHRLWYGLTPGTSLVGLANTTTDSHGTTTANPWPISLSWLTTWLQRNPTINPATITYPRFEALFHQSVQEFSSTLATDDPDLSRFRAAGGKLLIWHGLADQLIFPQGTVDYYRRVEATMGGHTRTAEFARLFLAPGAAHCSSIAPFSPTNPAGAPPDNAMQALTAWVQHDRAPRTLRADTIDPTTGITVRSRPLCAYPAVAHYDGHGSTDEARNFFCRATPQKAYVRTAAA